MSKSTPTTKKTTSVLVPDLTKIAQDHSVYHNGGYIYVNEYNEMLPIEDLYSDEWANVVVGVYKLVDVVTIAHKDPELVSLIPKKAK